MESRDLAESTRAFINELTQEQRNNWLLLTRFMRRKGNAAYDHTGFDSSSPEGACAFSYAIAAGMIDSEVVSDNGADFYAYTDEMETLFGEGSAAFVFASDYVDFRHDIDRDREDEGENDGGYDFAYFAFTNHGIADLSASTAGAVADVIAAFIGLVDTKNLENLTVHWKNGQKDKFSSIHTLREYFDLNPHRKGKYRKITGDRKVERVVYDIVTETIEI